jgi:multisubunit Na+/H+ antiporter MnhG subunit
MMAPASNDRKNVSKHILPTSSNLLGICFLILTLKKLWKASRVIQFVDKLDAVVILIFLTASILSYASMRAARRGDMYEKAADIVFLLGLVLLSFIAVVTVFELS